jgi:hypothetical protein
MVYKFPTMIPEIGPMNEMIRSRSEALVQQMRLPLQQRSAFVLTPQVLQARMGLNPEAPFAPLSIAELLFSNANGEPAPMPFASCQVELPATSSLPYCRAVFRKFAARILLEVGFSSTSDSVLDILADVVHEEVRRIAQTALLIQQGTEWNAAQCLTHALTICDSEALRI